MTLSTSVQFTFPLSCGRFWGTSQDTPSRVRSPLYCSVKRLMRQHVDLVLHVIYRLSKIVNGVFLNAFLHERYLVIHSHFAYSSLAFPGSVSACLEVYKMTTNT